MSNSIAWDDPSVKVIVGVDTHKHEHVAVAINDLGARLATFRAPANRAGYADLVAWARTLGAVEAFGTEGTGSYGAGLASFVRREGLRVVEVNHCDRRKRRNNGKDDTLDAESAARSVLSGIATAIPKSADGTAEMVRQIKIARDTAIKARSAAIVTLKTLLVNAPGALREALEPLTDRKLIERCAALRPGEIIDPTASVKHSLRALAAPPLSEPGVPIAGTGLSSGIMRLATRVPGHGERMGLASCGTQLAPVRRTGRCVVRPVYALATATARVVPFACACDDVRHSCSSAGY